jgi:hypothetical protein
VQWSQFSGTDWRRTVAARRPRLKELDRQRRGAPSPKARHVRSRLMYTIERSAHSPPHRQWCPRARGSSVADARVERRYWYSMRIPHSIVCACYMAPRKPQADGPDSAGTLQRTSGPPVTSNVSTPRWSGPLRRSSAPPPVGGQRGAGCFELALLRGHIPGSWRRRCPGLEAHARASTWRFGSGRRSLRADTPLFTVVPVPASAPSGRHSLLNA